MNVRRRLHRWARRRQGPDRGTVELVARRVYILPTRAGLMLGAVLFTMLVGALNYSNNMGFALAFAITALAIVSIHHCQANLAGLRVSVAGGAPAFAGGQLTCEVRLDNPALAHRRQLALGPDDPDGPMVDLEAGSARSVTLQLPASRRGRIGCPEIRLSTSWPFGLFRAWAWVYPDLELIAYPQPADRAAAAAASDDGDPDGGHGNSRGSDEFEGLRDFIPGESPARIAWKTLARSGELLAKDYRSGSRQLLLDWHSLRGPDPERKLAELTRLALDAAASGQRFALRLPGVDVPPGSGSEHLHLCLRALALHEASTHEA
jgi:uncharacterized protein (DUF58 family)